MNNFTKRKEGQENKLISKNELDMKIYIQY